VVKIYANEGHLDTVRRYKDGFLEGEFASYHANGTQSQSIQYKAGKKHGKETWWQDNGYKSYSATYLDGQLHGKTYNWDDQGYLISSSEFDMGNPMRPKEEVSAPAKKVEQ
jgi:antitoxin component YwqK of YwqJK toxin-antitoxin module